MSLIDKLIKSTKVEGSSLFETSEVIDPIELFTTDCPALNVAGTGKLDGKFKSGFFQIVGPSKHYKSKYALMMISSYMKQEPDSICIFYDTEFGASRDYFNQAGIDTNRVIHIPLENIEEFKFDLIDKLKNQIKRGDKVIFFIDSIGNMASKKEIEDTLEEKGTVDMTRAKMLKSVMRMAIPLLNKRGVMLIGINHVYQSQGFIPTTVVSGGCLGFGEEIIVSDGSFREINEVRVGDMVATQDGERMITHIWNPETLEEGFPECYEVEFEDGHKVICSSNHKFLVNEEWIVIKSLSVGTEVKSIYNNMKIKNIKPVGRKEVYDISVEGNNQYLLRNGVVSHNTGLYFGANDIWLVSRSQEKEGKDLKGYTFKLKIEKSRTTKEGSVVPITVLFDGGIQLDSGLLEWAKESGHVTGTGWYQRVDIETGEILGQKLRESALTMEFWEPILNCPKFKEFVSSKYLLGN